jgi:hypothetical protein
MVIRHVAVDLWALLNASSFSRSLEKIIAEKFIFGGRATRYNEC